MRATDFIWKPAPASLVAERNCPRRFAKGILALAVIALGSTPALADRVSELVAIHTEAIGGRARIDALKAMRATGLVIAAGQRMRFTMLAERPNKIRLETEMGARTLVQATDGVNPPWELDSGTWPPRYRDMGAAVAKTFAADAEYDDPLVAGPSRGYTLEYAGDVELENKKMPRILVTRNLTETFSLLLDPDTFFIVRRVEERPNPIGGVSQVVTFFDDYRPVDGVLVPHKIGLFVDGQVKQQTLINSVEPNPSISDDVFTRPRKITVPATPKP